MNNNWQPFLKKRLIFLLHITLFSKKKSKIIFWKTKLYMCVHMCSCEYICKDIDATTSCLNLRREKYDSNFLWWLPRGDKRVKLYVQRFIFIYNYFLKWEYEMFFWAFIVFFLYFWDLFFLSRRYKDSGYRTGIL